MRRWDLQVIFLSHTLWPIFLTFFILTIASVFVDPLFGLRPGDGQYYAEMAIDPFSRVRAPFRYRLFTPMLTWLLPTGTTTGFAIVNSTGLAITGILFSKYLSELGFNQTETFWGVSLLLTSPMLVLGVLDTYLVDIWGFVFLVATLIAARQDNPQLFAFILTVGVLARETVLLAVPIYALYLYFKSGLRSLPRALLVSGPAVTVLLGVRMLFPTESYFTLSRVMAMLTIHAEKVTITPVYPIIEIGISFGSLWILFLIGAKNVQNQFLRAGLYSFPLVVSQIFLAKDIGRLLFLGFPIILPIAIDSLRHTRIPSQFLVLPTVVALIFGSAGMLTILPKFVQSVASLSYETTFFLSLLAILHEVIILGFIVWSWRGTNDLRKERVSA